MTAGSPKRAKTRPRARAYARFAAQRREAQEAEGGGAVAGRDRVVADLLAAGDQLLVVGRGGEEAAALGVAEAGDHRVGQLPRGGEPARLEARFVEDEERFEQEGVVLEVGVQVGAAVLVGAQQVAVVVASSSRTKSAQASAASR